MVEEAPRGLGLSLNFPDKTEGPNYFTFLYCKGSRKKKVPQLMAGPLRGGVGMPGH